MVKGNNLSFNYTGIPVFDQASFSIGSGQKVALVGPNGAGKSTLFGLIAGTLESEGGSVRVEGSVALVPQEIKHDPILDGAESIRAYIDPHHDYPEHELENWLRGLELGHLSLTDIPLSLSGGQKTRLALARALLLKPDVLLLDEPTNFLDENGKKWVMQLLRTYPKTLLIVSHDIALLNTAIDKVLAINIHTKKIDEYSGTYDQFVRLKKQVDELLRRSVLNERKHIARMKKGLQKMDRYTSEKGVRQRTRLKKRIRLLEESLPTLPREASSIRLRLPEPARVGEIPLMARDIHKSYGSNVVLQGVSLSLYRNERVALLGKNGAGKSTLIKILV
ncbi:MAG: ATP-binding cassette domain-containing protein, partial [Candidatus Roizmanbacteria bacterium]|nr:ATP-binding cassette domain-containing protein [Candidatus Roizmanbacteria bacterium]